MIEAAPPSDAPKSPLTVRSAGVSASVEGDPDRVLKSVPVLYSTLKKKAKKNNQKKSRFRAILARCVGSTQRVLGGKHEMETVPELGDPFITGPRLGTERFGHTAFLLSDGRVLVIGGSDNGM